MGAFPDAWEWDGTDYYFAGSDEEFDNQMREVRALLCRLLEMAKNAPMPTRGRGRPQRLTELDQKILRYASEYANRTGMAN